MRYRFGSCVLDAAQFELTRDGQSVKLEPKVFDMLLYLLQHAGRVLGRDELLRGVWPDEHVSPSVVNKNIFLARRAIGQDAADAPIETVRGRGYRFGGAVLQEAVTDGAPEAPGAPSADEAGQVSKARPASEAPPAIASTSPPLVGRDGALLRLQRAVDLASESRGQLRLLTGTAGIGKTRLAREVCERAEAGGFRVLQVRCPQGVGLPPLWPWARILRQATDAWGVQALSEALGPAGRDLAALLPELAGEAGVDDPPPLDAEASRFRLFDALGAFLDQLGARGPHVVFIDDLQWADQTSVGALDFLSEAITARPVLLLLAARPGPATGDGGARGTPLPAPWLRGAHAERIHLAALRLAEVTEFTEAMLGFPAAVLAQAVFERSEGNAFVMHEVLRTIQQSGPHNLSDIAALASRTRVELPEGAKQVVRELLAQLPDGARPVLETAAVLGRDFDRRMLATVGRGSPVQLMDALQAAIDLRLMASDDDHRFSFSHGLVRDTLYGDLPLTRRTQLHMAIADALTTGVAAGRDPDPHALHHHLFCALPHSRVQDTVRAARAAAEAASRVFAHADAAEAYGRAIEALGYERAGADEESLVALWMLRARALRDARKLGEARTAYLHVIELARRRQDPVLLAEAAIGLRRAQRWRAVPEAETEEPLQEALDALPASEHALRARLLSHMAGVRDFDRRTRMAARAARIVQDTQDLPDAETLHAVYSAQLHAAQNPQQLDARLELAAQLLALADAHGRREWAWEAHAASYDALCRKADLEGCHGALQRCAAIADTLRDPALQWEVWRMRIDAMLCAGQLSEAQSQMEDLARAGARIEQPFAPFYFLQQMLWLLRDRGPISAIASNQEQTMAPYPWATRSAHAVFSLTALEQGDPPRARVHYDYYARRDFQNLVQGEDRLFCAAALATTAVELGDQRGTESLLQILAPFPGLLTASGALLHFGTAGHFVGLLQAGLGRTDDAAASLAAALDANLAFGACPAAARSHLALAGLMQTTHELSRAHTHAQQAAELAEACGADAILDNARRFIELSPRR